MNIFFSRRENSGEGKFFLFLFCRRLSSFSLSFLFLSFLSPFLLLFSLLFFFFFLPFRSIRSQITTANVAAAYCSQKASLIVHFAARILPPHHSSCSESRRTRRRGKKKERRKKERKKEQEKKKNRKEKEGKLCRQSCQLCMLRTVYARTHTYEKRKSDVGLLAWHTTHATHSLASQPKGEMMRKKLFLLSFI